MSKSVLLSIKPKYCELIASGKKTIEVRKTNPKLDTPFKVYIYETKALYKPNGCNHLFKGEGKVIGEFVCDTIIIDRTFGHDPMFKTLSCMNDAEIASYCTANEMYGFHISDLVIYDKPKELSEFCKPVDCHRGTQRDNCVGCWDCEITRPPQSWCYVEEL